MIIRRKRLKIKLSKIKQIKSRQMLSKQPELKLMKKLDL
jgi:hypothetical protein